MGYFFHVWGLISDVLGVSNFYVWGLNKFLTIWGFGILTVGGYVLLRLGVSYSYVWGLVILTFMG